MRARVASLLLLALPAAVAGKRPRSFMNTRHSRTNSLHKPARTLPPPPPRVSCDGAAPPVTPGSPFERLRFNVSAGLTREYILYVPSSYNPTAPMPLVFAFHGWGNDAEDAISAANFNEIAEEKGYILVAPEGYGDNSESGTEEDWRSWNAGGSAASPGPAGPICAAWADPDGDYCYDSCKRREGG